MQTMQRKFGRLLPRTADESQVAVLLKDFEDADVMLTKLIESAKAWRDAWRDILTIQQHLVEQFHALYSPIVGAGPDYQGHEPAETTSETIDRVARLQEAYLELKTDMLDEVNAVDARIIKPAMEGQAAIQPMKKVIKKRQDRKLDYERYQGRYDATQKKTKRSERDNTALAKHESDLARATQEYQEADDRLKSSLPPIIFAAFSLLPPLLSTQIMIQNTLLGNYYTVLHNYCEGEGFPSPPPPMTDVISTWRDSFMPLQRRVESKLFTLANGKAVRQPMQQEERQRGGGIRSLAVRNSSAQRRPSNQNLRASPSPSRSDYSNPQTPVDPVDDSRVRISSVPSQTSLALSMPNYASSDTSNEYITPSHAPAGPRADYFSRDRQALNPSNLSAIAATKKKPPPPPPKRIPTNQGLWVTALYDFSGQGHGDLVFEEGDRIKVLKKTDSLDDWWDGELNGCKGQFPANYCK